MLVGEIWAKGTYLKTDELDDAKIERYGISLKMKNKDSNNSNNELILSEFSVAWFRCVKKSHKSNKCNLSDSSNK